MSAKTKLTKTLEALKNAPIGIHSFDLMRIAGTTRVAARILDLKKMGYSISSKLETLHGVDGCRYKLENGTPITKKKPEYVFSRERQMFIEIA